MKKWIQRIVTGGLSLALSLGVVTGIHAEEKPFDGQKVKVGVASEYEEAVWKTVKEEAAKEGIDLELVIFTDYVQPNIALQDGSIDLNAFQHIAFLEEWNEANKGELVPLGFTYVAPIRVYSEKIKNLDEIKEGDKIAIPSDPTNGGRALLALQQAGVIKVDPAKGVLPGVNDITDNPHKIEIIELEAAQLPNSLKDVTAAVINNNFALDAGLKVNDAIFQDGEDLDTLADDYKNIIASRADGVDNPLYKHIVELYQTETVAKKLAEVSEGADLPAWTEKDAYPIERSKKAAESENKTDESAEESSESAA